MVGELWYDGTVKTPDAHAEVFKQLTDSLKTSQVTEVDFSSCGIGAVALGHLSDWVRDATAGVARVVLSGNAITDGDKDLSGLTALCEALPDAKNLTAIDFSNCGIRVKGVNEIAKVLSAGAP